MKSLSTAQARRIWLRAQRLDASAPFGDGPEATARQSNIWATCRSTPSTSSSGAPPYSLDAHPAYRRAICDRPRVSIKRLRYWTHALSYVPTGDLRFFIAAMKLHRKEGHRWFGSVTRRSQRS